MIINSNNKDSLMNGMSNRGFNQTPKALKERLYNELHMHKTIDEKSKPKKPEKTSDDPLKIKKAYDNLNRLNKKL